MKKLILALCIMGITGCAGQTPLQRISDGIDKMQAGPIHQATAQDIETTLQWANALTDPEKRFGALQCPSALKLVHEGNDADLAEIQKIMAGIDKRAKELANGSSPMILLALTKAKYGESGGDPQARIDALKNRIFERFTLARNSCANLIPERQMIELLAKYFGMGL